MADRRPRFRPHLPLVLAVLAALVPPGPPPAAHAATFANTTSLAITAGAPGVTDGPASLYAGTSSR